MFGKAGYELTKRGPGSHVPVSKLDEAFQRGFQGTSCNEANGNGGGDLLVLDVCFSSVCFKPRGFNRLLNIGVCHFRSMP
jgi:hypothetical protein